MSFGFGAHRSVVKLKLLSNVHELYICMYRTHTVNKVIRTIVTQDTVRALTLTNMFTFSSILCIKTQSAAFSHRFYRDCPLLLKEELKD